MKKYVPTPQDPLCSFPRKIAEEKGFEIWHQNCKGTEFFSLQRSGRVIQNFTDPKKAEQAMIEEVVKAKEYKPWINPELEALSQKFKEISEMLNQNSEDHENNTDT